MPKLYPGKITNIAEVRFWRRRMAIARFALKAGFSNDHRLALQRADNFVKAQQPDFAVHWLRIVAECQPELVDFGLNDLIDTLVALGMSNR